MSPAVKAVAAASLVAGSACCLGAPDNACVAAWSCTDVGDPAPVCLLDPPEYDPSPLETCAGEFHSGASCQDLGFTVRCGARWVRPGGPCP